MITTGLHYHSPATVDETVALLAEFSPDAAVLGGGTMLVPMMSRGELTYGHIIDLARLGLNTVEQRDREIQIGARTTYSSIVASNVLRERLGLLPHVAARITGGAQLRNVATAGGSACYANPASDVPAVLVALSARMSIAGPGGSRSVPASEFFRGPFRTALKADELLVQIAIPVGFKAFGYHKLKLCEGSWPIVTAAAVTHPDGSTTITVGGVSARPLTLDVDADFDTQLDEQLQEPWGDVLAPAEYRRDVAPAVARKALAALN
jgi:CO/xanthine dehydrogenase FAD-binding subunit